MRFDTAHPLGGRTLIADRQRVGNTHGRQHQTIEGSEAGDNHEHGQNSRGSPAKQAGCREIYRVIPLRHYLVRRQDAGDPQKIGDIDHKDYQGANHQRSG